MNKQEYRAILGRLPIENPTPEDMAQLCPHLTQEQAVAAFHSGSGYVVCPPLRVRGAFQIVTLEKGWLEEIKVWRGVTLVITGTKEHQPRLSYAYAGRARGSYGTYRHIAEAVDFAEDNWGDELILDTWKDVVEFRIQDPSDLYQEGWSEGYPKTKAVLYICLNREWNQLINDHTKPESVLIDEAISEMTLDMAVWHELKGGCGGFTEYNCAYCGDGLHLCGCGGCGHRFKDDFFRCGWATPLSQRMAGFLQANGHVFKKDPYIARQAEAQRHEDNRLRAIAEERQRRATPQS